MARRIIYVVDATEAPADSQECRNGFLRGLEGLQEEVDSIEEATTGMLGYIGEWHSHPNRECIAEPKGHERDQVGGTNPGR